MASNLACIGLAVGDAAEFGQLVATIHRSAREADVYDGVHVARWQHDSGAALILGWRSGELLDLIPAYAAARGGLLSGCRLINDSVASAAVVDAGGEQLTAIGDPRQASAHARLSGTVLAAERAVCALTGQPFTIASVRTAGFEADLCLAGSEHPDLPVPGSIISGTVFLSAAIDAPALQPGRSAASIADLGLPADRPANSVLLG